MENICLLIETTVSSICRINVEEYGKRRIHPSHSFKFMRYVEKCTSDIMSDIQSGMIRTIGL